MTDGANATATFTCNEDTLALVRLSARIAGGTEDDVAEGIREAVGALTSGRWVEELILQSYLFCGFPRALNALRVWRGLTATADGGRGAEVWYRERSGVLGAGDGEYASYQAAGEKTCGRVYGPFYERLRHNIAALHPEMDDWMIVEGYGKVLSRPGLDLGRRELCTIAACAATAQWRQLHSHLHGAGNVGVPDDAISRAIDALSGVISEENVERARALWMKVRAQ